MPLHALQSFSNPRWQRVAPLQQRAPLAVEPAELDPVFPELSKTDVQYLGRSSGQLPASLRDKFAFRPGDKQENSELTEGTKLIPAGSSVSLTLNWTGSWGGCS